jgi:hypothetical protein
MARPKKSKRTINPSAKIYTRILSYMPDSLDARDIPAPQAP